MDGFVVACAEISNSAHLWAGGHSQSSGEILERLDVVLLQSQEVVWRPRDWAGSIEVREVASAALLIGENEVDIGHMR